MGITYINGTVSGPHSRTEERLRFLVDSGAQFSLIPHLVWKKLKLKPIDEIEAVLMDGTVIERKLADCILSVAGKRGPVRVILGEVGDYKPLLGAITLENFGFVLDPFRRELRRARIHM